MAQMIPEIPRPATGEGALADLKKRGEVFHPGFNVWGT